MSIREFNFITGAPTDAWFIDSDDNTTIHFFPGDDPDRLCEGSLNTILFEQTMAPSVIPEGTLGTTPWEYLVVALDTSDEIVATLNGTTLLGNATLDATNFNRISWEAVPDAVNYVIFRTRAAGTPNATGKIGESSTLSFDDTGLEVTDSVPKVCKSLDSGPEVETNCPPLESTAESFKLSLTATLPDDFLFQSGSVSRFSDRLSLFLEELTPSRFETPVADPTNLAHARDFPVRSFISRYDFVNIESLGTSNGNENQVFVVSGSDIIVPTKGTPLVFVGGEKWREIDSLSKATVSSRVFKYSATAGRVTFGDGVNGAIPSENSEIVLRITIRNGGGTWTFAGKEVNEKDERNLGVVKSAKGKILYNTAEVAFVEASKLTQVTTQMNVIEQKTTLDGTLIRTTRLWSLAIGGDVTVSGGELKTLNTTASEAFSVEHTRRETVEPVTDPSKSHKTDGSFASLNPPAGTIRDVNTHIPLDVDDSIVYPDAFADAPTQGLSVILDTNLLTDPAPLDVVEMTPLITGVRTASPDIYEAKIQVYPIFEVWETIVHNYQIFHAPQIDGEPCSVEFVTGDVGGTRTTAAPYYAQIWVSWPEIYYSFRIGSSANSALYIENAHTTVDSTRRFRVFDTQGRQQGRDNFSPIIGGGNEIRLTNIADIGGDFTNHLLQGPFQGGFISITEGSGSTATKTVYEKGLFARRTGGDDTEHPEWVTQTLERQLPETGGQSDQFKAEINVFGSKQSTDYICVWTGEKLSTTVLPDHTQESVEILSPITNECINLTLQVDPNQDFRIRLIEQIMDGFSFEGGDFPFLGD